MFKYERVLVASDNALIRGGLKALLEARVPVVVEELQDVEAASSRAAVTSMDLVLLAFLGDAKLMAVDSSSRPSERPRTVVLAPAVNVASRNRGEPSLDGAARVRRLPLTARTDEIVAVVLEELGWTGESPAHAFTRAEGSDLFTPKEDQVFRLLVQGLTNKQISRELWVTVETVKAHLTSIYRKVGVKSRAEAIASHFDAAYTRSTPFEVPGLVAHGGAVGRSRSDAGPVAMRRAR